MAKSALNGVFQRLRSLAAVHTGRGCGDRELLARFLQAEDEAAFTLLVERHGPMVLALCRRVLRHKHDADDACQATFLVLARKAASLRKQDSLSSWLHGVAYRISVNLKRQQARRQRREQAAPPPSARDLSGDISWRELQAVLDEELERLPARYRAPLILCYLQGKTRDEAAHELGAKPGSLHGLLERGRKLLRDRLTRRGLTLSAALFGAALTETAAKAAVAPALVVGSAQAALAIVRGQTLADGLIAPHVLSLVKEASKIMFLTKIKIGAALVVCAGMLTTILGGALDSVSHAQDHTALLWDVTKSAQPKTESDEAFIRRISKDLRGSEPSAAEVHFFVASKDAGRRQKLIDLFIQERQTKEKAQAKAAQQALAVEFYPPAVSLVLPQRTETALFTNQNALRHNVLNLNTAYEYFMVDVRPRDVVPRSGLVTIQGNLFQDLFAAKEKKEVAGITQKYLDQLLDYVKDHAKNADAPDAMMHIVLVYRAQGKNVEADAWRAKLLKEHPKSNAATMSQAPQSNVYRVWFDATPQHGTVLVPSNTPVRKPAPSGNAPEAQAK